jgi:putative transposase
MATATKTIIQQLETRHLDWVEFTRALFNEATAFYFEIIQGHDLLLDLPTKQVLTELERLTVVTPHNPQPAFPLQWELPAYFRRAAINTAIGAARSFYSNLTRWKKSKEKAEAKGKKFDEHPPVPPREFNQHPLLYAGLYELSEGFVLIKLFTGKAWCWIKFKLSGRNIAQGWQQASPKLVIRDKRIELHIPFEKTLKVKKIQEQIKQDPGLKICAVDLNINSNLAVCRILKADGTQIAFRFIGGAASSSGRRKRALGRIAKKRSKTNSGPKENERDNKQLWEKVNNIDKYEAHRVSRRVVQFAAEYGAAVIVFEHLGNFKPEKGKYSKRANSKRSYWLRGRVYRFTKYKAFELGILTSRVNPKDTSRDCAICGAKVARHNRNERSTGYRTGAPLFTCPEDHKGNKGNSELNACSNIGKRFFARYRISTPEKPLSKGEGVSVLYSAGVKGWKLEASLRQDNRDGQVAPPSVSAVNCELNAVAATPQVLRVSSIHGCA